MRVHIYLKNLLPHKIKWLNLAVYLSSTWSFYAHGENKNANKHHTFVPSATTVILESTLGQKGQPTSFAGFSFRMSASPTICLFGDSNAKTTEQGYPSNLQKLYVSQYCWGYEPNNPPTENDPVFLVALATESYDGVRDLNLGTCQAQQPLQIFVKALTEPVEKSKIPKKIKLDSNSTSEAFELLYKAARSYYDKNKFEGIDFSKPPFSLYPTTVSDLISFLGALFEAHGGLSTTPFNLTAIIPGLKTSSPVIAARLLCALGNDFAAKYPQGYTGLTDANILRNKKEASIEPIGSKIINEAVNNSFNENFYFIKATGKKKSSDNVNQISLYSVVFAEPWTTLAENIKKSWWSSGGGHTSFSLSGGFNTFRDLHISAVDMLSTYPVFDEASYTEALSELSNKTGMDLTKEPAIEIDVLSEVAIATDHLNGCTFKTYYKNYPGNSVFANGLYGQMFWIYTLFQGHCAVNYVTNLDGITLNASAGLVSPLFFLLSNGKSGNIE